MEVKSENEGHDLGMTLLEHGAKLRRILRGDFSPESINDEQLQPPKNTLILCKQQHNPFLKTYFRE